MVDLYLRFTVDSTCYREAKYKIILNIDLTLTFT